LGLPLVIGPLIAADPPPTAFMEMMRRPVTPAAHSRWHPARLAARLCAAFVNRAARRRDYLRRARQILVGTRTALQHVPEAWHGKCRRVTYAGVEHEVFVPPLAGQSNRAVTLLFVGRLIPYKGVEMLLRAVALAAGTANVQLLLVGSADRAFASFCTQFASDMGISDRVEFQPPVPRNKLPALYQQADIFCFPTLCDTYGIALLEAMSCGCAVVASDVAGAGEIVDGANGLKISLTTPDQYVREFAEAIGCLAANPARRAAFGAAARRHVLQNHDWPRIGEQVLRIYEELEQELGLQT